VVTVIEIDWANAAHAAGLLEVLDSYAREPVGGGRPIAADVRARLVPELAALPNAVVLLALEAGRVVGIAICFVGYSTFAAKPLLNVHDLAVLPERRGLGAGLALLRAVEARARALGCCKLTLEVAEENTGARALYARFGFGDYTPGQRELRTFFVQKKL
jgi:ribosomal protein S18 acetylase RimI-like enzyme